jgi:transcriptional regulator with XRE-family HTH domain
MLEIGTNLRKRRNELGWSQEAVEATLKNLGMDKSSSQPNYSNWENGKAIPTIPQLYKLAEALKTTPEVLLNGQPTVKVELHNHDHSNHNSKNGVFYQNGEAEHWRTIADERGERCMVEKKLIERLEQENQKLEQRNQILEQENEFLRKRMAEL